MADKLDQVAIRMIEQPPLYSDSPMDSPEAAIRVMQEFLSQMDRELFCIVNLQADLKPINMNVVSVGALDHAVTHPREVFKSAILSNAVGILMIHNHPSGSLTPSKADIAVTDRLRQAGAILLPVKSVGVMGDERTYEYTIALRAVISTDGMTADWVHLPYDFMAKVSNDIINKVRGVNRVVYDISSKPPATIEWE